MISSPWDLFHFFSFFHLNLFHPPVALLYIWKNFFKKGRPFFIQICAFQWRNMSKKMVGTFTDGSEFCGLYSKRERRRSFILNLKKKKKPFHPSSIWQRANTTPVSSASASEHGGSRCSATTKGCGPNSLNNYILCLFLNILLLTSRGKQPEVKERYQGKSSSAERKWLHLH